ncbi:MAG TPA: Flp pilus assembly protein CpaB [Candidatus Limnocylindria bacterium]
MIARRWLVALAIAAGCMASGLYLVATQRADVVVLSRDVVLPRPLTHDDLDVRSVAAELAPADALARIDDVVGLLPRAPMLSGQIVLARSVATELPDFSSGLALPTGLRAIAIPVSVSNAIGGAIVPGARVDVLAVPVLGRAPAGRTAELLSTAATVLDVRGENGTAFAQRDAKPNAVTSERIGSVVIAITANDEIRFADRIATSTFVLALVAAR